MINFELNVIMMVVMICLEDIEIVLEAVINIVVGIVVV